MSEDLIKYIRFAIDTEEKGIKFYTKCLHEIRHPRAMELFDWLIRVEKGHKTALEELMRGKAAGDAKAIKKGVEEFMKIKHKNPMFPKESLKKVLHPEATVISMFNEAMQLEKQGILLYQQLEKEQKDPDLKRLFKKLAKDEEEHRREIADLGYFVFNVPPHDDAL